MPLEVATFISDLNASNPPGSDQLAQADDHIRLIKSTIKTTFPNVAGAVTLTHTALNTVKDVGSIVAFPKAPTGLGTSSGTGFVYLECNGAIYNVADYPALGAFYGSTFGGNGSTTFGVPNLTDTNRFLRSRSGGLAVGTSQANQNKSHQHTGTGTCSGTTGSENNTITHNFSVSGTTGGQSADHTHTYNTLTGGGTQVLSSSPGFNLNGTQTGGTSNDHTHSFSASGTTAGQNQNHQHAFSGSISYTTNLDGGTEARPEAFVVIYCVKTGL